MWTRLTWVASALAVALVFSACQDTTEPVALEANARNGGDTKCRGVPSGDFFTVEPTTGTFDNVVVPRGATCHLLGSTVRGNVKALEDSRLFIEESSIRGNVEGDKASAVNVLGSTVGGNIHIIEAGDPVFLTALVFETTVLNGNVQIEKGRFPLGDWFVVFSDIQNGNIKIEGNGSTFLFSEVFTNTVAGDVQVLKNTGPTTTKFVDNNVIGGNVQCWENDAPFFGGPNIVAGNADGQCFGTSGGELMTLRAPRPSHDLQELTLQKRAR